MGPGFHAWPSLFGIEDAHRTWEAMTTVMGEVGCLMFQDPPIRRTRGGIETEVLRRTEWIALWTKV